MRGISRIEVRQKVMMDLYYIDSFTIQDLIDFKSTNRNTTLLLPKTSANEYDRCDPVVIEG